MKIGHVTLVLALVAYVAFEATMASKARYRMEADYIYAQMVGAGTAVDRCGEVSPSQSAGFDTVLERARQRLARELAAGDGAPDPAAVERRIDELRRAAEVEMTAAVEAEGCDGPTVKRGLGRYRIYARK